MSNRPLTMEDLRWIVCPVCHQFLQIQTQSVVCVGCGRRYPIIDEIPVLLSERVV